MSIIWWSPGIVCTVGLLAKPKGGLVKIECKFYDRTTTPECNEDRTVWNMVKTKNL